ncbi:MAG: 2'-5' RNA ligase family protein [Promethearchaeota archaeon]
MQKVPTSAVIICPPKEKWAPIQEIRKIYDRHVDRWMPHITVLYPFRPEEYFTELEMEFLKICSKINPFRISLKEFHYFHHGKGSYTIWLKPEPMENIIKLQSKLQDLVPDCNDVSKFKKGYVPHLSVGQFKGPAKKLNAFLENLQSNWNPINFMVKSIFFIARKPFKNSKFTIKKKILLGKEKHAPFSN